MILSSDEKGRLEELEPFLQVPDDYVIERVKTCTYNSQLATLYRFEKKKKTKSEEHFSLLIQHEPYKLLGMMWLDRKFANQKMLAREEVEQLARNFLEKADPDLNAELNNLWIARHDETIVIDGQPVTIPGMKYKCYRESQDDYAWVIVSYDGQIMTFERDTKWEHKRVTTKCLHGESE